METKSQLVDGLRKYSDLLIAKLNEDQINNPKEYLHLAYLRPEYSTNMAWASADFADSIIAADVVSLGSSAPLKSRGVLSKASGDITKFSIGYRKTEKELQELYTLQALGGNTQIVAEKALNDIPRCTEGVNVRNEIMFLQGLSEGFALTPKEDEQGVGVRVSYGYKPENELSLTTKWDATGADPMADLQALMDKAADDANPVTLVVMDKKAFNLLRNSDSGKIFGANALSQVITDPKKLRATPKNTMLELLQDEFGVKFLIVDSTFKVQEKDGTVKQVRPWKEGAVVLLPSENVGRLVYSTLVEERKPASHVIYNKVGDYTLISNYMETNPPAENTIGQALVLPVIDNGGSIYRMDTVTEG